MNEMDELSRFRAEIPARDTTRAEEIFRTALLKDLSHERPVVSPPRNRFRQLRPTWRVAIAVPLALGLTAGVTVAMLPGGNNQAAAPLTVKLTAKVLADRAAAAALTAPGVPAGQWIYQVTEHTIPAVIHRAGVHNPMVQDGWMTADGTLNYGAGIIGDPIFPYDKLDSLPRDPAALDKYFRSQDPVKSDNNSSVEFGQIRSMLFGMVLPPWLEAEMFHALALIPNVQVRQNVKDIAGRDGVAFLLPETKQSDQQEIILDASDYHLLAHGDWGNPRDPSTFDEDAVLQEYPVAELGSTQPSTTPPSAAGLAAERLVWDGSNSVLPSARYTADQWLYRDLRTGGNDRQVWATVDDTEQAQYVHGTLQVCKRSDPCAAAEQWLMPAGPSYQLVYPGPVFTQAELAKLRKESLKQRMAALQKARKAAKAQPALPQYPRPLLNKLNSYNTGCADVADDCNAVNVVANMLTGYGNDPYTASNWFLSLADVPGVSIQQVTDSAGQQVTEFTFPAQDGVTGILASGGSFVPSGFHYVGYVRDGQQTLVLNQALVSGPGVLPGK
ncbi:MAG: hypothetical protein JO345_41050 [Streptosporangiaceae bacterium]|nr:hypothetical protein [Streptosporangiaceae bacterium]